MVLAVKVMRKKKMARITDAEASLREVQVLSQLPPHPSVIRLHQVMHSCASIYLLMDHVGKDNLYRLQFGMPDRKMQNSVAQEIFTQIANGLSHIHLNQVAHRDIKPENMVLRGMKITIVDFGLAVFAHLPLNGSCGSLPFAA